MASSSASAAAPQGGHDITALKNAVYDACEATLEHETGVIFHQASIFELNVMPQDVGLLLIVTQSLLDDKLFKIVATDEGVGWKLRTRDEAKKYRGLTAEQEIVYSLIDEAEQDGLWTKTIKARSNLHDSTFKSAIKHLESKNMISDMKSVEHPTRKMYIKSTLRPSERATGGPWYTDGELDEEFIAQMMDVLFQNILSRTFYHASAGSSPRKPKKTVKKMTVEEVKAARDQGLGPRHRMEEVNDERAKKRREFERWHPMPAGYQGYPTANQLTAYVDKSGFTSQTLSEGEIQQLLDIMCYDDRIERVKLGENYAYRALRKTLLDLDEVGSGLSEAPCGRCPVFDLCEEGGPVGPSNCEYFNDWLSI